MLYGKKAVQSLQSCQLYRIMCSAELQTLCLVSPLCEDFDVAVIVLELDCAVE